MKKNKLLPENSLAKIIHKQNNEIIADILLGVTPKELDKVYQFEVDKSFRDSFIIHKSAKKGQTSFRITKDLLDSLISTSLKIKKQPKLIITINSGSDEYIITSSITKNKVR
jgi:hypothetical protein